MLYVIIDPKKYRDAVRVPWDKKTDLELHLGRRIAKLEDYDQSVDEVIQSVTSIQADGDELELIKQTFIEGTIPMTRGRVQSWYGDLARTILHGISKYDPSDCFLRIRTLDEVVK